MDFTDKYFERKQKTIFIEGKLTRGVKLTVREPFKFSLAHITIHDLSKRSTPFYSRKGDLLPKLVRL